MGARWVLAVGVMLSLVPLTGCGTTLDDWIQPYGSSTSKSAEPTSSATAPPHKPKKSRNKSHEKSQGKPKKDAPTSNPNRAANPPALRALQSLKVRKREQVEGYQRRLYGAAWSDAQEQLWGRNGCNTRDDILDRDLREKSYDRGTNQCIVRRGTFRDPYGGKQVKFQRGPTSSRRVEIDHVVPLLNSWQTGAKSWTVAKRRNFANDPLELIAVSRKANQAKWSFDAATWLPVKAYRCRYVARQVAVKKKWKLWVTEKEQVAMARVLTKCPGQTLPRARDRAWW